MMRNMNPRKWCQQHADHEIGDEVECRPGHLVDGRQEEADSDDDEQQRTEGEQRSPEHAESEAPGDRVQRPEGHAVEQALQPHAIGEERGERQCTRSLLKGRETRAPQDLGVEIARPEQEQLREDDHPDDHQHDREDAAEDAALPAGVDAVVLDARGNSKTGDGFVQLEEPVRRGVGHG